MRVLLFFLCLVALLPRAAAAQFLPEGALVVRGQPIQLTLPSPTPDTLHVIYRPSAAVSHTDHVRTDGAQTLVWTPSTAGVVRLAAGDVAQNVSVRYVSPPISGIFVLLIAGFILFGGAIYALRKLFAD